MQNVTCFRPFASPVTELCAAAWLRSLYEGRKASCFVSETVITVPKKFPFIEVHSLKSSCYFPTKAPSFSTHFFQVSVKHYAGRVKLFAEKFRSSSRTPCFSSLWAAKRLEFILQAPKKGKIGGW
jgi:hypothetical protein